VEVGVPASWVTGDEVYGGDRRLGVWLEQEEMAHVLAVKSNEPLWANTDQGPTQVAAAQLVAQVNPEEWVRLSAGEGAKGPRIYDWVRVSIRPFAEPDKGYWLLARRSVAKPEELAYYVCFGPGEGLDQYEVRRWVAWYRHITLVLLAHAFLVVTRAQSGERKGGA